MAKNTKTKKETTSSLLIDDKPMMALPKLLHRLGSDRAIILQQLHYWTNLFEESGNERMHRDGRWWVFNTIAQWQQKQFTWLTVKVVGNILRDLEKMGLISSRQFYAYKCDHKKWYSLNYDAINALSTLDIAFVAHPTKELVAMVAEALNPLKNKNVSQETIERSSQGLSNMLSGDDHIKESKQKETNSKKTKGNIDSVSGENAGSTEELTGDLSNKDGSKSIDNSSGTASPGQTQQDSRRRETHETQSETVAPPKKKWNPSIPIGFDASGYIKLPPLKDVDPKYKAKYSETWPKVYRETQFMVAEEWIDDITIEEDEDGEVLICDKNGDWTEQEAFGQGGCLPLRKLRDIAAADPYSGFSVDEYNQFIIERFNYHWNRR